MTVRTHQTLEMISVSALVAYERNARTHGANQIAQIVEAVRTFGWTNPLLVGDANLVLAGHGRLEAARQLGMTEVPCLRISGLSEAQQRALILSDNKIALNAGWDEKMLAEELRVIQGDIDSGVLDFTMPEVIGFDTSEVDELMRLLDEPEPEEETRVVELEPEPAVCRTGDTWILGAHRLTIGGTVPPRDADVIIRLWERETKLEAHMSKGGETFASRAKALGVEFVRPEVKSQKARRAS